MRLATKAQVFQTKRNYQFSTNPNNNVLINNYFNTKKEGGIQKKVKFNNEVEIYNVESYKEHNKKFCYNEEEELDNLNKKEFGYNDYYFNKYANQFNNDGNNKVKNKSECCCIIL
jgi:hypothetical protein